MLFLFIDLRLEILELYHLPIINEVVPNGQHNDVGTSANDVRL